MPIADLGRYDTTDGLADMVHRAVASAGHRPGPTEDDGNGAVPRDPEPIGSARGRRWCWGSYGDGARPAPEIAALDRTLGGLLSRVLKSEKFEGKPGQISYFHTAGAVPAERVLVVGLGPLKRGARARDAEPVRRATAAAVRRARDLGAATIAVFMPAAGLPARERAQAIVEGALLGTYRFDKYLKEKNGKVVRVADRARARPAQRGRRARRGAPRARSGRRPPVSRATSSTSRPTW